MEYVGLCFNVSASPDNVDNSETLSVRITVPLDPATNTSIGQIVYSGSLPPGVTITNVTDSPGVVLIEADGPSPAARQALLNSVLCSSPFGVLELDPAVGFAGTVDLQVDLIVTEGATGSDQVVTKTATVSDVITVSVINPSAAPSIQPSAEIGEVNVAIPSNITFNESESFPLSSIDVEYTRDPQVDEQVFLESFYYTLSAKLL